MIAEHPNTYNPESDPQITSAEMVEQFTLNSDGTLLPIETYRYVPPVDCNDCGERYFSEGRTSLLFVETPERPIGEEMPPYQVVLTPNKPITTMAYLADDVVEVVEVMLQKKHLFSPKRLLTRHYIATATPEGAWRLEENSRHKEEDSGIAIDLRKTKVVKVINNAVMEIDPLKAHEAAISRMTPNQMKEFTEPGEIMLALEQFKSAQSKNT